MKSDIRVNYSTLQTILEAMRNYSNALAATSKTMDDIQAELNNSKAESIEALYNNYRDTALC